MGAHILNCVWQLLAPSKFQSATTNPWKMNQTSAIGQGAEESCHVARLAQAPRQHFACARDGGRGTEKTHSFVAPTYMAYMAYICLLLTKDLRSLEPT